MMRAAKNSSTAETRRRGSKMRSRVSVSLWSICVCGVLAALSNAPVGLTQNRTGPRGTPRPARPAPTPQPRGGIVGPYVPPPADEPPPPPWRNPVAAPQVQPQQPQGAGAGKQVVDAIDENEIVRINASEVLLPVTVRDAEGRLVTGLGRKVAESFEDFRRAAEEFAGRVSGEDRFCLVKFDDRVELLLDWSKSRLQLRRALNRLSTGVFTRFNDALLLAAREQFQKNERRRALVVLSDGIDSNRGSATAEAALRALLETQVTVYAIANTEIERARKRSELDNLLGGGDASVRFNQLRIGDLRESLQVLDASEQNLAALTRSTGGRLYRPQSFRSLESVYAEIADELRHQYALYYTPTAPARDGRFRRVRVEVAGRGYEVSTRVGYYSPRR